MALPELLRLMALLALMEQMALMELTAQAVMKMLPGQEQEQKVEVQKLVLAEHMQAGAQTAAQDEKAAALKWAFPKTSGSGRALNY